MTIKLNKNRGWRGIAELITEDEDGTQTKTIFSFSQQTWNDLLKGYIVTQDDDNYIILNFDNVEALPKPTQQRSVLIKNFTTTVVNDWVYDKRKWEIIGFDHYYMIFNYLKNNNYYTTSDWNHIGVRVSPMI